MSIAQGTTHYNYPQVQLNDRPTFADFNPAFEDIDAKLYSLITGASTDHSAIESLQTGLGETNLLLASVKQTADSASGKADTNAENITLLQTGLGNTDRTVANKLDSVAIAEPYDAAAGTYAIGDIVVYNGQRYKCTTAVAVAEPFDADKWTGEDVETVLERLATPAAENVTLAPITGMTADDVQEGIAELKSALADKEDAITPTSVGVNWGTTLSVSGAIVKYGDVIDFSVAFTATGGLTGGTYYQLGQLTEHIPNTTTYITGVVENATQDCVLGYIDGNDGSIHVKVPNTITNETVIINASFVTVN